MTDYNRQEVDNVSVSSSMGDPNFKQMMKQISECIVVDDFVFVYLDPLCEACLQRITKSQQHYSHNEDHSSSNHRMAWAAHWAERLKRQDPFAKSLNADRKVCLELLYALCNRWRPKDPATTPTVSDADIVNVFKDTRVKRILYCCLVMDRANALYNMVDMQTNLVGMHWYSQKDTETVTEWRALYGKDRANEPTINKRLTWLFEVEGLDLQKDFLKAVVEPCRTPLAIASQSDHTMDVEPEYIADIANEVDKCEVHHRIPFHVQNTLQNQPYDVFLVHAGEQKIPVDTMKHFLEEGKLRCFLDCKMSAGASPVESMRLALTTCRYAVVVLSREIFHKQHPASELMYAFRRMEWIRQQKHLQRWDSLIVILYNMTVDEYSEHFKVGSLNLPDNLYQKVTLMEWSEKGRKPWSEVCKELKGELNQEDNENGAIEKWVNFLEKYCEGSLRDFPEADSLYTH